MVDTVVAFFAGMLFSWYFWPIMFITALFFEAFERSVLAVFTAILAALGFYGFFGVGDWSWYGLATVVAGYIGAGIAYSVWRWYRYVDREAERFNKRLPELKEKAANGKEHDLESAVNVFNRDTNYREKLDTISYWVLMWPISGIAHLCGDILRLIQKTITTFFSGLFDSITNRAKNKIDVDFDNPLGREEAANV